MVCLILLLCCTNQLLTVQNPYHVDFDASMGQAHPLYNDYYAKTISPDLGKKLLNQFKSWYEKNILWFDHPSPTPRIPKKIHQIWLGSPLPEKFKLFTQTWQKHNPEWEYKLWTDTDIAQLHLENQKTYDAAINYAERSDIARYEILYRFGGVYVDIDFECLQPLDIIHHCFDFYAGLELPGMALFLQPVMIQNAIIGSIPSHPIMRKCIDEITKQGISQSQSTDIVAKTGPLFFSKIVLQHAHTGTMRDIIFPASFLFPIDKHVKDKKIIETLIKPETFAIHHWAGSWILKEEAFVPGIKIRCRQDGNILKFAIVDERKQ